MCISAKYSVLQAGSEPADTAAPKNVGSNDAKTMSPEDNVWIYANMLILGDEDFRQFAKAQKVDAAAYQDSEHVKVLYLNTEKF